MSYFYFIFVYFQTVESHKHIFQKYQRQYRIYQTKLTHYNQTVSSTKSTSNKPTIQQHVSELLPKQAVEPIPPKKSDFIICYEMIKCEVFPVQLSLFIDYLMPLDILRRRLSESDFIHCVEVFEVERQEAEISKFMNQTWDDPKSITLKMEKAKYKVQGVKVLPSFSLLYYEIYLS